MPTSTAASGGKGDGGEKATATARRKGGNEESTWPSCSASFQNSVFLVSSGFPRRLRSLARRDIWCRPLPQSRVPSAISSALKPLQLQTPTVSSPLLPPPLRFLSPSLFLCSTDWHSLSSHSSPSYFPLNSLSLSLSLSLASPWPRSHSLFPSFHSSSSSSSQTPTSHSLFPSFRFSPSVFPTSFPFTFGRRYRKSNFVTGTASSARHPAS